ncbi:MAG: acyl-CoA synthetase [Acidimicrobiales bacterium]
MIDPNSAVLALIDIYGAPQADATDLFCERHPPQNIAFTVIDEDLNSRDVTYGELAESSRHFAAGLAALGVGRGDRVATLMGKSLDLVIAVLGVWRLGAVHVPLFTAFAPGAIAVRTEHNGTKVIVVDASQRSKLLPGDDIPDRAWHVVTTGEPSADDIGFGDIIRADSPIPESVAVGGTGTLIELFTSGTTGRPKAVPVTLGAVAGIHMYQHYGLDHTNDDVFWNAADPGWAYGLFYAIVGPLATGRRALMLTAPVTPQLIWSVLSSFRVTNFAGAPTLYRAMKTTEAPGGLHLRHCSAAGEPLTPDVVAWSQKTLGFPVRDHYGQTETGMLVANSWHPDLVAEIRTGSMGRPLPGWTLVVLRPEEEEVADVGEVGRLAIDVAKSPLMTFHGYEQDDGRTAERFTSGGRWYLTGDVASQDADGYLFFGSRADDVILMAGYRIGPFEVESVLVQHDAVAEVAVVGVPDELRGEVLEAFVVLAPPAVGDNDLIADLQQLVKTKFAAHAYPRAVHFVPELPKTPSGKVQRYLLRRPPIDATNVST